MGLKGYQEMCSGLSRIYDWRSLRTLNFGEELGDFSGTIQSSFQKREKWDTFIKFQRTNETLKVKKGKRERWLRNIEIMHANALGISIDNMISFRNSYSIKPESTPTSHAPRRRKSLRKAVSLRRRETDRKNNRSKFSKKSNALSLGDDNHGFDVPAFASTKKTAVNQRKSALRSKIGHVIDDSISSQNFYAVSMEIGSDNILDCSESTFLMEDNSVKSSSSTSSSVNFAEPLITSVYERPYTMAEERESLFYTNAEYRRFKRDSCQRIRGKSSVHFSNALVSDVWILPESDNKNELFYTEDELRNFLRDFILSRAAPVETLDF